MTNLTRIKTLNKDQIFNYTGELLEEQDPAFVKLKDQRTGNVLRLNKAMIISIEEVSP